MPNLELKFNVHDNGYRWIDMRKSKMIGHRDPGHSKKFTKSHLKEACREIATWMVEYNEMVNNPAIENKPDICEDKIKMGACACVRGDRGGCNCHD